MPTNEEIRSVLAELRGSGGVGHGVESLEVFLLFPDDFRRKYAELCARALKGAVEDQGGRALEAEGGVGKARVKSGLKGKMVGAGAGGGGKRYKHFWTVRDENALEVKGRVDRRLRALARDMTAMLEAREEMRVFADRVTTSGRCAGCQRFLDKEWAYCPGCGSEVAARVEGTGRRTRGVEGELGG